MTRVSKGSRRALIRKKMAQIDKFEKALSIKMGLLNKKIGRAKARLDKLEATYLDLYNKQGGMVDNWLTYRDSLKRIR
jgi:hypothetical protein